MKSVFGMWVILHRHNPLFFRMQMVKGMSGHLPLWSTNIEHGRVFPSEAAAEAVIREWGIEEVGVAGVLADTQE